MGILSNNTRPVTRHSGWWPDTVTPSIDQALHQFLTLLLIWNLWQNLTFYLIPRGFHRTFATGVACQQRTYAYSPGHLVLSHFGTFKCSNVETNISWACLVFGLSSFEHPSVLLFCLGEFLACVDIKLRRNGNRSDAGVWQSKHPKGQTTLCPKSPSARGVVACLPVRLLFKSTKHNAFYPV